MSEMAVVAARKPRLHQLADEGNAGAATALELAEEPGPFLSTVQIGITLVGILIGAFGGAARGRPDCALAGRRADLLQPYAGAIAVALVVILLTYLTLVLGELVPKQIALQESGAIAALGRPAHVARWRGIASPLVAVLGASSSLVLRILGAGPSDEPAVTEEDVRVMLEQGAELGVFEPREEEIVGQVFRLGGPGQSARSSRRRSEIMWIDESDSADELREKVIASGRSRLPVANGEPGHVTGIVLAKDLLAQCMSGQTLDMASILQPALFVPETTPALDVVERFKETHSKMAHGHRRVRRGGGPRHR